MDWQWLSEDTLILPHGWTPETGFLQYRWDNYSEMMMMYLLGMGSSSHPLPARRGTHGSERKFEYDGIRYIGSFAPLFIHQYSEAWFDFRGKRDKYADYFQNSAIATEVHRRFCLDLRKHFPDYSEICGGSRPPIRYTDTKSGAARRRPGLSTVRWCHAHGRLVAISAAGMMRVLRTIELYASRKNTWSRYGSWMPSIR